MTIIDSLSSDDATTATGPALSASSAASMTSSPLSKFPPNSHNVDQDESNWDKNTCDDYQSSSAIKKFGITDGSCDLESVRRLMVRS
jgi:hypothetical protein